MSLVKQLVLGLGLLMVLAFGGSFWLSLDSVRQQMQSQLAAHAQDAATALGLSLAPQVADPTMSELLVNAVFDSGYFSRIQVVRIEDGEVLQTRTRDVVSTSVPPWFSRLIRLQAPTGEAVVMRGWQQYAVVQTTSSPAPALERMWQNALRLGAWLTLCGFGGAVIGIWLLRRQLRPLRSLAVQAEAVGRREYRIQNNLPRTPELRPLVVAMNQMVTRLRRVMEAEAGRTEGYRRQAYEDPLTGLPNRLAFDHALAAALTSDDQESGFILAARLTDLAALNQTQGAERVDSWLRRIAEELSWVPPRRPGWTVARVRASEFMLIAQGASQIELDEMAGNLSVALADLPLEMGIVAYRNGRSADQLLRQVDQALSRSTREQKVILPGRYQDKTEPERSPQAWRKLLEDAIEGRRLIVHFQPVISAPLSLIPAHSKLLARITDENGGLIPAGQMLPWVIRYGLGARFDLSVIDKALDHLGGVRRCIAVSITAETLASDEALDELARRLAARRDEASRLIIEVDARQLRTLEALDDLIWLVKPFATRVALQHFGHNLTLIGEIALLGLAYLKIDSGFLRDLDTQPEKCPYLRVLIDAAATADIPLVAEQVQTESERAALEGLGIIGWQGFAVGKPAAWNE
jgi:EAL domain-containing protein (putative c-di-GMP-specific phosphodiesterase class I)/GGDEF domain-containing protein